MVANDDLSASGSVNVFGGDDAMGIHVHREGPVTVVAVSGDVDLLTADHLRDTLAAEVAVRPGVLVVDLDSVEFLSSTGLAALALAHRAAVAAGVALRIVATSRVTLRPLQVTSMTEELFVFGSRADALAPESGTARSLRIG
ncbi:STAS domain-containing protein [Pseudonocardia sp. GCM10023141]|uniref:STAS domain-containing protein n=1 Tax=Pseudonocardia sp. GCM10023141 TaxID=3252653 RepID=UPI003622BEE2